MCGAQEYFSDTHDRAICSACNEWREKCYSDPDCELCGGGPYRPLAASTNQPAEVAVPGEAGGAFPTDNDPRTCRPVVQQLSDFLVAAMRELVDAAAALSMAWESFVAEVDRCDGVPGGIPRGL